MLWAHRRTAHPKSVSTDMGARTRMLLMMTPTSGTSVQPLMKDPINPQARTLSVNMGPRPLNNPPAAQIKELPTMVNLHLEPPIMGGVTRNTPVEPVTPICYLTDQKFTRCTETIETCCRWSPDFNIKQV